MHIQVRGPPLPFEEGERTKVRGSAVQSTCSVQNKSLALAKGEATRSSLSSTVRTNYFAGAVRSLRRG
jgi:hypothetical protein